MSDEIDNKELKKKNESSIHGRQYEKKTIALIAIKCLLDREIKDFWILSNPVGLEKFDDAVLHVELTNGEKHLYMIQVKHKETKRSKIKPIVASMLDGNNKNFSLNMYQEAFNNTLKDLRDNKNFFKNSSIDAETKLYFILYNNCTVNEGEINDNINFECVLPSNYFKYIDSSQDTKNVLTVKNKLEKYEVDFLDNFYFYTKQKDLSALGDEIKEILGVTVDSVVDNIFNYICNWFEPSNNTGKLYQLDIKIKLLEIIFGDYLPPIPHDCTEPLLFITINSVDFTIITEEHSTKFIWKGILNKMMKVCDSTNLQLSSWYEPITVDVEEKLITDSFKNIQILNDKLTTKDVFFVMVAQGKVPFFIKSSNRLFDAFMNKIFPALNIHVIVYNPPRNILETNGFKVFSNLNDVESRLCDEFFKKINISFQGKCTTNLYTLTRNITQIKELKKELTVDIIIKLIQTRSDIGNQCKLPEYYINRNIKTAIVKKQILQNENFSLIICEVPPKVTLKNSIELESYIRKKKSPDSDDLEDIKIFTTTSKPNLYGLKCPDLLEKQIVVLKYEQVKNVKKQQNNITKKQKNNKTKKQVNNFNLRLIQTNVSMCDLQQYIDFKDENDTEIVSKFSKYPVNVISNNAGMGKSMLLNYLSSKFAPTEWVINLELGKYHSSIKCIKKVEELIDFFYDCEKATIQTEFQNVFKQLYISLVESSSKVIWLIDDLEEANEANILKLLSEVGSKGIKMWIVSRPLLKAELENTFKVVAMELVEFSKDDQMLFFEKYFEQHNIKPNESINIMEAIKRARQLLDNSFIGICQQTMMLAEVFLSFEDSWNNEYFRSEELYEKFINLKVREHPKIYRDFFLRTISKLALNVFFNQSVLQKVFDWEEFTQDLKIFKETYKKNFLVAGFIEDDVPIFSHRTYAEFLAAQWLVRTVKKQNTPFNLKNIIKKLYYKELTTVRLFFDKLITKNCQPHNSIIDYKFNDNQLALRSSFENKISNTDILGRTIIHIISSYGNRYDIETTKNVSKAVRNTEEHVHIIKDENNISLSIPFPSYVDTSYKIEKIHNNELKILNKEISRKDIFLNLNAIEYALMSESLYELETMLPFANSTDVFLNLPEEKKYCILYHSILHEFHNILEQLNIDSVTNIKVGESRKSLLHLAIENRNLPAVQKLSKNTTMYDWQVDIEENTPLHLAFKHKNKEIIFSLFQRENVDVNFLNLKNKEGRSHLHFLAYSGDAELIQQVIDWFPNLEIDSECNYGNTPFMVSIMNRKIDAAEILKRNGANINHRNKKNTTALHYSIKKGFLNCTRKLISWDCEMNSRNFHGFTPLMVACYHGRKSHVQLLLKHKVNVNLRDKSKWTALHHAVKRDKINIISILLENGANVNSATDKGHTPLMIACLYDVPEAVEVLLKYKADVNILSNSEESAGIIALEKKHYRCFDNMLTTGMDILEDIFFEFDTQLTLVDDMLFDTPS